jgi:Mg2+/citrate symporter
MSPSIPDKDAIALLPLFDRLGLDRITLVRTGEQAQNAHAALVNASAWGSDTESKPTFRVGAQVAVGCHSHERRGS